MNLRINRKAIFGLDDLAGLMIATFVIVMLILAPIIFKYQIVNQIQFEVKYNSADLSMLALLSLKNEGKPMPLIIGEHLTLNNPSDISFVDKDLEKIVPSKCFELKTGETQQNVPSYALQIKSSISTTNCIPDSSTKTKIPLPYNPQKLVEILELHVS